MVEIVPAGWVADDSHEAVTVTVTVSGLGQSTLGQTAQLAEGRGV